MNEKNITLNREAFQVWWFIAWRGGLTAIVLNLIAGVLQLSTGEENRLIEILTVVLSTIASVYFVKLAINRNYKGFRLSAIER